MDMKHLLILGIALTFSCTLFGQAGHSFTPDTTMSLADFKEQCLQPKDEIWVLDFWASWCGPCRKSIPELIEIHDIYKGESVRFFSFSFDKNRSAWEGALKQLQMPWTQFFLPKPDTFIDTEFPVKFIPTLYLIDKEANVTKVPIYYKIEKKLKKLTKKKK